MNIIELNNIGSTNDDDLLVPEVLLAMVRVQAAQDQVQAMQADLAQAFADRYHDSMALMPAIPVVPEQRESAVIIDAADRFLKRA